MIISNFLPIIVGTATVVFLICYKIGSKIFQRLLQSPYGYPPPHLINSYPPPISNAASDSKGKSKTSISSILLILTLFTTPVFYFYMKNNNINMSISMSKIKPKANKQKKAKESDDEKMDNFRDKNTFVSNGLLPKATTYRNENDEHDRFSKTRTISYNNKPSQKVEVSQKFKVPIRHFLQIKSGSHLNKLIKEQEEYASILSYELLIGKDNHKSYKILVEGFSKGVRVMLDKKLPLRNQ